MKRAISMRWAIAVMALCLPLIPNSASAQQEKGKESVTTEQKPVVVYRIEFNVREVENGKRLNSRNYMMVVEDHQWGKIRVGNRVPYKSTENQFQYQDVRHEHRLPPSRTRGQRCTGYHCGFLQPCATD